jgi:hypothetical protein
MRLDLQIQKCDYMAVMNQQEIERLRRKITDPFDKEIKDLERQIQQKQKDRQKAVEAFETVLPFLAKGMPTNRSSKRERTTKGEQSGTLIAAVKDILPDLDQPFNIKTVIDRIIQNYPEFKNPNTTSISGILKKFHEDRVIERVEKGQGNKPSWYRLPEKQESRNDEQMEEATVTA